MGQSVLGEKELAIREQNFEKAGQLLEYEMDIRVQVQVLKQALQINEKTSLKRVQIDMVMEEDIADVIAAWTGIPMNKISESESKNLLNGRCITQTLDWSKSCNCISFKSN